MRDTIYALSSGSPPAAIGVVRISGPLAFDAVGRLAGRLPQSRRAAVRTLRAADGAVLDRGLVLVFPGPDSATGEDLAELHLHGGRAVVDAVLGALAPIAGLRAAEPGEFTRRAFENGRIDLAEAEGLADLLSAETEAQRRNALAVAGGALSRAVGGWQARLLALAARVEAVLDFSDEGEVGEEIDPSIAAHIASLASEMGAALAVPPAERLRDGIRVALAGSANSGKSTLLNALVQREAALVSPIPGTTRDVVEAPVAIEGISFLFSDLAGIRDETADPIEQMGIARARMVAGAADIILWLGDEEPQIGGPIVRLHARADQPGRQTAPASAALAVSAVSGQGLDRLRALLLHRARTLLPCEGEVALSRRQRQLIADAHAALAEAEAETNPLILAEHLRLARAALDRLTGRAGTEEMLDSLFGRFCIGK